MPSQEQSMTTPLFMLGQQENYQEFLKFYTQHQAAGGEPDMLRCILHRSLDMPFPSIQPKMYQKLREA